MLARLPSWVGDCVAAEPALRSLAAATDGGARLSLALPRALLPLLEASLPRARRIAHERRAGERAADWRGHDVAILFPGSFRSAWTAWAAGIPRRVGWSRDGRALLLTDRARPPLERGGVPLGLGTSGAGRRYLPRSFAASAAELVGLVGLAVRDARPRLAIDAAARERVRARLAALGLAPGEPFVLACVGARPGSAKGYPPRQWAAVLAGLAQSGAPPALLAFGPGEEGAAAQVLEHARSRPRSYGPPAADLGELLALAAQSRLVLAADGGSRHVAAAAGADVVCVFGPTDPRHGALGLARERIVRIEVACGPCHRERCPLVGAGEHRCLRDLEPERIVHAALRALDAGGSAPPR